MKRITSVILITLMILSTLLATSCSSANTTTAKQTETEYFISSGKIVVGNASGGEESFDVELLKKAVAAFASGEKATIAVEVKTVGKEEALSLLTSKSIDVIVGLELAEEAPEGAKYSVRYLESSAFVLREDSDFTEKINTAIKDLYKAGDLDGIAEHYGVGDSLKSALGE